jgi:hypothetical protein
MSDRMYQNFHQNFEQYTNLRPKLYLTNSTAESLARYKIKSGNTITLTDYKRITIRHRSSFDVRN